MNRRHWPLMVLFVGAAIGCLHFSACAECHDDLETGDYVVAEIALDQTEEWQWMKDALVHVDREEKFLTVRYVRDGTTYELRYEIYDPTGP